MFIKKEVSYLRSICTAIWIAKLDYYDEESYFMYGFEVETEKEPEPAKDRITVTLALEDIQVGDIFVIGKKAFTGQTQLKWYVVKDKDAFMEIKQEETRPLYDKAMKQREQEGLDYFELKHTPTWELEQELQRRKHRLDKRKKLGKVSNVVSIKSMF